MNFEKQMKKRGNQKLDSYTPNLYEKPHHFPLWAKVLIPVGSVFLSSAIALSFIIPIIRLGQKGVTYQDGELVKANVAKITTENNTYMSQTTYNSYMAFAKKFSLLMLEVDRTTNGEESVGVSIPDAYINLAISAAISTDEARNDVLNYLELPNMDALRTAVKEVIFSLATLHEDEEGRLTGGYNLNSIWLNPEKVILLEERDEQLYEDLANIFDASIYFEALTSEKANQYLADNGLKDMPTPEIKLDDSDDPSELPAMNSMSVFYCLDYFDGDASHFYKKQYQSQNHKMDFTYKNQTTQVDYINTAHTGTVYRGTNFYGSSMNIGAMCMSFFLPDEQNALPSSIIDDVVNRQYEAFQTTVTYNNEEYETDIFDVNISAPYFYLDNDIKLKHNDLAQILPVITKKGAGERLVKPNSDYSYPMYISWIEQFSVMKFNYDGFYSCSVTITGYEVEEVEFEYCPRFDLILNHPYVFEVNKSVRVSNKTYSVPMVIGEIVTPSYQD